jgi:hypothetical protein
MTVIGNYCIAPLVFITGMSFENQEEEPPETDAQKGKFGFHKK